MKLMCKVANTPSLRDTTPQGEAFRLPLRGAVANATVGWQKKSDRWSPLINQPSIFLFHIPGQIFQIKSKFHESTSIV